LFDHIPFLIHDVLVYFAKLLRQWCFEFGQDNETSFAPLHFKENFGSFINIAVLLDVVDIEHLMSQILFKINSKCLRKVLDFVGVLEQYLALVIYPLNLQQFVSLLFVLDVFLLVLLLDSVFFCLVFENFDDEDLVWLYDSLQEHFVIDELLSILLPVLLFEDVGVDVDEGANLIGPDVGAIVVGWQ
jgi:hypothetical protein